MSEPQYWLPHKELSWVPGIKKKEAGDSTSFATEEKEVINVPTKDVPSLSLVLPDQLAGIDDVCALGVVHEGALLHTVRVRYMKDLIYTRVARTLIAVNPFSLLPIYSTEIIDKYASSVDTTELPPHIYAIGQDALDGLRTHGHQAVLISGESGAGKTESAKLILAFVTDAVRKNTESADESEEKLEDRVLQTNAVLEAFGNAMTARNNNSSRFGKWLDLRFSHDLDLLGFHLTSYLLETTRCIGQANNERSFHIFYQLINAKKDFPDLHLLEPKKYRYLQNGLLKAPGIDDGRNFGELCDALKVLGFSEQTRGEIFRIVAGVLNLGNVDFKDSGDANCHDACMVKDEEALKTAANMLGMDIDGLRKCITERKITIGKDTTVSPLRCEQARSARDSMAKLLYGRLFLWLIGCLNRSFSLDEEDDYDTPCLTNERLLGVLDIAGFESFEKNSLEQLLINLSNEHLHQNFNEFVFKAEVAESVKEGIPVPSAIDFTDNADVLAFIDSRGGCLDLLDETMVVPKATNEDFVSKVFKQHEKNPVLVSQKFAKEKFGIKHFAGEVVYSSDGWLEKNSDSPPGDAPGLLEESSLEVLNGFASDLIAEADLQELKHNGLRVAGGMRRRGESEGRSAGKAPMKRKAKSVCSLFRTSLKALMEKIGHADPHYVLCMKPNMQKVPKKFNAAAVMEQLLLTGVLAAVQIRQQGFAYRIVHDEFAFEYRCIVDTALSSKSKSPKALGRDDLQKLVEALPGALEKLGFDGVSSADFAVGQTKVFFKFAAYKRLQDGRRSALWNSATRIQSKFRGHVARKAIKERKEIRNRIRECLAPLSLGSLCLPGGDQRGRDAIWPAAESLLVRFKGDFDKKGGELIDRIELVLHEAVEADFRCPDVVQAERIFNRLQMELEIAEEVTKAQKSIDPIEVEKTLSRASSISLPPPERIADLERRLRKLRAQLPLKKALERALAAGPNADSVTDEQLVELQDLVDAVAAAGIVSGGMTGGGEETRLSDDYEAYTYKQFLEQYGQDKGKTLWEKALPEEAWMPELGAAELWKSLLDILTAIEEKKRKEMMTVEEEREAELKAAEEEARKKAEEAKAAIAAAADKKAAEEAAAKAAEEAAEAKRKEEEARLAAEEAAKKPRKSILKPRKSVAIAGEDDDLLPQFGRRGGRMKTITGLALAEQVKLINGLKKAVDEYNIEALEELLKKATENGIREDFAVEDFSLATARSVFAQLQGQDFLKQEIEKARQEARKPATPVMALQRLEHLAKQLGQMPGNEEEAQEASRFVQKALVAYSRDKREEKTVFDSEDPQEIDLASKIFGDLSQYSRLKPAQAWKSRLRGGGGRASVCAWRTSTWVGRRTASRRQTGRMGGGSDPKEPAEEGMMLHGKVIVESLTWPPEGYDPQEYDNAATQNFRNILVAMGDRAAQECQRKASCDAVVMLAKEADQLRDEVYMQVLKQLIKNPNPRSVGLGWELLYNLCQEAPASEGVIEFVRTFITKGIKEMDFSGVSYFFTLRLARLLGCRGDFSSS